MPRKRGSPRLPWRSVTHHYNDAASAPFRPGSPLCRAKAVAFRRSEATMGGSRTPITSAGLPARRGGQNEDGNIRRGMLLGDRGSLPGSPRRGRYSRRLLWRAPWPNRLTRTSAPIRPAMPRSSRSTYDPAKVSFEQLLDVFWTIHDPTTLNRQGPDLGNAVPFGHFLPRRRPADRRGGVQDPERAERTLPPAHRDRDRPRLDILARRGISPEIPGQERAVKLSPMRDG